MRLVAAILALSAAGIAPGAHAQQPDPEPAPLVELSAGQAAAIFDSWAGRWSGAVREYDPAEQEMREFPETLDIERTADGLAMRWVEDGVLAEEATTIAYNGGALIFDAGEEYESVEPIVDFEPPNGAGDWRIVTAYQDGPEDALYDVVEVYSMRFGRLLHEIASAPSDAEQLSVDMQAFYERASR